MVTKVCIEALRPSFVDDIRQEEVLVDFDSALISEEKVCELQMENFKDVVHEIAQNLDEDTISAIGRMSVVAALVN